MLLVLAAAASAETAFVWVTAGGSSEVAGVEDDSAAGAEVGSTGSSERQLKTKT